MSIAFLRLHVSSRQSTSTICRVLKRQAYGWGAILVAGAVSYVWATGYIDQRRKSEKNSSNRETRTCEYGREFNGSSGDVGVSALQLRGLSMGTSHGSRSSCEADEKQGSAGLQA
jgi:hypothetical protein